MLERIKTILDIRDNLQDGPLNIFIENITSHLLIKLKQVNSSIEVVPAELNFIIEEITIRRFNRIGSEGMKSESVEGHRVDFYDLKDEFVPYQEIIDGYKDDSSDQSNRGRVMFI